MQLDKTRIVIRERTVLEIMDLGLSVVREYFKPLVQALLLGAVPFALLNFWMIAWMERLNRENEFEFEFPLRYVWDMSLLVFVEAPLATAFITAYLGQAVFVEKPSLRQVVYDVLRMTPRLIWCQVILRGVGFAVFFAACIVNDSPGYEVLLFFMSCGLAFWRAARPFINEIVLLERNPLFGRGSNAMTIGRRSALLHSMVTGDLIAQWFAAAVVSVALVVAFTFSIQFGIGAITNEYEWGWVMSYFGLPVALWITAGFMAVVRFLYYLDSRIRQEGWEVELRLRAEAARLASRLA
jgi:hypothetical protein